MTTTAGAPVSIYADLYPTRVVFADGRTLDPVKTIVGLDRVWLYEPTASGVALLETLPLDDLRGSVRTGFVATVGGEEISIEKSAGCGCGSPAKSARPFTYRQVMSALPPR
jgi:hypothetical protein